MSTPSFEPLATNVSAAATAVQSESGAFVTHQSRRALLDLLLLWCGLIVALLVLQLLHTGYGMKIGPIGEDLNWQYFMQNDKTVPMQFAFWEVDHRNPLAPWWYKAFKLLIVDTPYGIYVVHRFTNLLCSVSLFLLIRRLGRGQYDRLAFFVGVLGMLWDFSDRPSTITWTMLAADSMAIFAVTAYCKFVDEGRQYWLWMVTAIFCYFIAIGTYTLQISTPIAIFCLALLRPNPAERTSLPSRLHHAIRDVAPFAIAAVLFLMIWNTTSQFMTAATEKPPLTAIVSNAFLSLYRQAWSQEYSYLARRTSQLPPSALISAAVVCLIMLGVVGYGVRAFFGRSGERSDITIASGRMAVYLGACAAGLVGFTVALEATSSTWVPGTRLLMLEELLHPLLYGGVIYLGLEYFRQWIGSRVQVAQNTALLTLCAIVFMLNMDSNYRMNEATRTEEAIQRGMKAIVPAIAKPTTFVLLGYPGISPNLGDIFAKDTYRSNDVNLKILVPGPTISVLQEHTDIVVGPDEKGIFAESTVRNPHWILTSPPTWIPYSQVVFFRWTDNKTIPLDIGTLEPNDFQGYRVVFDRERPPGFPGTFDGWTGTGTYRQTDGSIFLPRASPESFVITSKPLTLHRNAHYAISLKARSPDPKSSLLLDLYNGASYDYAEQDVKIQALTDEYKEYQLTIPAGANPPPTAFFRIVSISPSPIWVRDVQIIEK